VAAETPDFPWYRIVRGDVLEQGDLLLGCPRFVIPPEAAGTGGEVTLARETVDAVVLTQSCDLTVRADGQCEASDVLLCPLYFKKDLSDHPVFTKDEAWEEVRKGRRPFFHVLNECRLPGHERDFALIDFHGLFTLGVDMARAFAAGAGDRVRLLPPYREHLSQAFARLFMRVGLPADIPPFGKRK
jgi:hypothetical protein